MQQWKRRRYKLLEFEHFLVVFLSVCFLLGFCIGMGFFDSLASTEVFTGDGQAWIFCSNYTPSCFFSFCVYIPAGAFSSIQ